VGNLPNENEKEDLLKGKSCPPKAMKIEGKAACQKRNTLNAENQNEAKTKEEKFEESSSPASESKNN
jgi:hypothetical protein